MTEGWLYKVIEFVTVVMGFWYWGYLTGWRSRDKQGRKRVSR